MAPICNSKIMNVTASNKILYDSQLHSQMHNCSVGLSMHDSHDSSMAHDGICNVQYTGNTYYYAIIYDANISL